MAKHTVPLVLLAILTLVGASTALAASGSVSAIVAALVAASALAGVVTYARRARGGIVYASVALALQALSITLAFNGDSLLVVVANVIGLLAGTLAITDRLIEAPALPTPHPSSSEGDS